MTERDAQLSISRTTFAASEEKENRVGGPTRFESPDFARFGQANGPARRAPAAR